MSFLRIGNINKNFIANVESEIKNDFCSFLVDTTNQYIYIGDHEGKLYAFDLIKGFLLSSIDIFDFKITDIEIRYDLNLLIVCSQDEVKVFKIGFLEKEKEEHNFSEGYLKGSY